MQKTQKKAYGATLGTQQRVRIDRNGLESGGSSDRSSGAVGVGRDNGDSRWSWSWRAKATRAEATKKSLCVVSNCQGRSISRGKECPGWRLPRAKDRAGAEQRVAMLIGRNYEATLNPGIGRSYEEGTTDASCLLPALRWPAGRCPRRKGPVRPCPTQY